MYILCLRCYYTEFAFCVIEVCVWLFQLRPRFVGVLSLSSCVCVCVCVFEFRGLNAECVCVES